MLVVVGVLVLFVGCVSEEENVIMVLLFIVKSEFMLKMLWSVLVGDGVGYYFLKLVFDYVYDKVFVVSWDGVVKVFDL